MQRCFVDVFLVVVGVVFSFWATEVFLICFVFVFAFVSLISSCWRGIVCFPFGQLEILCVGTTRPMWVLVLVCRYPESAEMTHASSVLSDDGRGWPIMSTGDSRPEDVSVYNKYSGEWFVFIVLLLVVGGGAQAAFTVLGSFGVV